jgi:two-component system NtrC family sensor kinase
VPKHSDNVPNYKAPYRRLLAYAILSFGIVSIVPLLIMAWINFHQYERAFHEELERRIAERTFNTGRSLEFFLSERLFALSLVVREHTPEELGDPDKLDRLLKNMQKTFGGVVDLGFIEMSGRQISYAGPFLLQGKDYSSHDWFHEVTERGVYISEVFLGYRKFPHFVIAVRDDVNDGRSFVLRTTVDTDAIRQILGENDASFSDVFLVNRNGIVQTPSRNFGEVLTKWPLPAPSRSNKTEIREVQSLKGPLMLSSVSVNQSPFILVVAGKPAALQESRLFLFQNLIVILATSILLIGAVIISGSVYMVRRLMETDRKRIEVLHHMEYTDRMAAIGRLASGVAHEINNPLAVIYEKAGLLSDILADKEPSSENDKQIKLIDSVLKSVERCSLITRRLLGFAKDMDVKTASIHIRALMIEVLSFLEKEAHLRGIVIETNIPEDLPIIESDRGRLQQVFLNIINNAYAAVKDGGKVTITAAPTDEGELAVRILDNGSGIAKEHLPHIFEPFFTTKEGSGTGLGLSITYGIVEKLGGKIAVTSEVDRGTTFTIYLPLEKPE